MHLDPHADRTTRLGRFACLLLPRRMSRLLKRQFLRRLLPVLGIVLVVLGGGGMISGGWIHLKAEVAQWLIARSWLESQSSGLPVSPWSWSDQRVAGRLTVPALGIEQYIFDDDSGAALAFGPGFSALGSTDGPTVISGHRDTHFAFLQALQRGVLLSVEFAGSTHIGRYRVTRIAVVDSRRGQLPYAGPDALLLVTCFPFDTLTPGGPLRFVVVAELDRMREPALYPAMAALIQVGKLML